MLLHFNNVNKTYRGAAGTVTALDGISLEVQPGDFIAIRGPSGCGKTTLLLTAGTLLKPDSGELRVLGEEPYRMSHDARASFRAEQIGFVFQQFHLVPYLSVLDNVLAPSLAAEKPGRRQRAEELVERFGLTGRAKHVPGQLSSGERQRCALARALLNDPKLLLADEPTGNLDEENAEIVLKVLKEFAREGGGVLLVTHDPRAADAAGHSYRMRSGRLEAADSTVTV
jgi:putative ABC transport system ATP-binding protein